MLKTQENAGKSSLLFTQGFSSFVHRFQQTSEFSAMCRLCCIFCNATIHFYGYPCELLENEEQSMNNDATHDGIPGKAAVPCEILKTQENASKSSFSYFHHCFMFFICRGAVQQIQYRPPRDSRPAYPLGGGRIAIKVLVICSFFCRKLCWLLFCFLLKM